MPEESSEEAHSVIDLSTDGDARTVPEVGDEINYRSMEGCTVAVIQEVRDETVVLDNGFVVPDHCVLEVIERSVNKENEQGEDDE